MAEWGTDMLFRLAGRLGQVLSPRPASAEVIKADEGTYTLTGEDVERFRALIGNMMRSRYRATPEPATSSAPAAETPETPETPESAKPAKPQASFPDAYWNAIIEDMLRTRGPSDALPPPNQHDPPEVRELYARLQTQYRDALQTYRERYPEEYEREQEREQEEARR